MPVRRYMRDAAAGGRDPSLAVVSCYAMPRTPTTVAPKTTSWFRQLDSGRIEIFLKIEYKGHPERDYKIRAHGLEEDMYELVAWFEARTGTRVQGNWRRVNTGPNPGEDHLTLDIEGAANGDLH